MVAAAEAPPLRGTRPAGGPKQESVPKATLKYKYYSTELDPTAGTKVRTWCRRGRGVCMPGMPACRPAQARSALPVSVGGLHKLSMHRPHVLHVNDEQKAPSQQVNELAQPVRHAEGWRPKPKILELLNMADFTHHVRALGTEGHGLWVEDAVHEDMVVLCTPTMLAGTAHCEPH